MKRVYIAGPYSRSAETGGEANIIEIFENIRRGKEMAAHLFQAGFAPFCPFQDYDLILHGYIRNPVESFRENSIAWLRCCDAVILLPGWEMSGGVKAELEIAKEMGIPVFKNITDTVSYFHEERR